MDCFRIAVITALGLAIWGCRSAGDASASPRDTEYGSARSRPAASSDPAYVLGHTLRRIDGAPERLDAYRGQVVVLVNVASRCGMTPQYALLESLYRRKKSEGLVILGFPANNYMDQEPGTNDEIAQFCRETYDVTFPMFEKISVRGDDAHPLYRQLAMQPEPIGSEPEWNFAKFLVDRRGHVIARFPSRMPPDHPEFLEAIEAALAQ